MKTSKLLSIVTTASMMLLIATPAFALDVQTVGNGSGSNNDVSVEKTNETYLEQTNDTTIENKINLKSNTGKNVADDNTNGDVKMLTGKATSTVGILNKAGMNAAEFDLCDCDLDTEVLIKGNGSDSNNGVELKSQRSTDAYQDNSTNVENQVRTDSNTGSNRADDNTGGDVEIETGDASTGVYMMTHAGMNALRMGKGNGNGGSLSARIIGNGSESDNEIVFDLVSETYVEQTNDTDVENDVRADVSTGDNDANDNTGGEVEILTGDADLEVGILTNAGFNFADIANCGCAAWDGLLKIAENGSDSDSEIAVEVADDLEVFQENDDDIANEVDGELETGSNRADDNTGEAGDDPAIETGDAEGAVSVENNSGFNSLGHGVEWDFDFSFDLDDLLSVWGL